jgi:hypothetical protein
MSDTPVIHGFNVPSGRRLDGAQHAPCVLGTIERRSPATKERVALAKANFVEAKEKDFSREGSVWTHKQSGLHYSAVSFDPLAGTDAAAGGVSVFVQADDRLTYLRRIDWEPPRESEVVGEIGAWKFQSGRTQERPGSSADLRAPLTGEAGRLCPRRRRMPHETPPAVVGGLRPEVLVAGRLVPVRPRPRRYDSAGAPPPEGRGGHQAG